MEQERDASIDARHYAVERELDDGTAIRVRAITPADKDRLRAGFHRLSERSIYLRFFQPRRELSDDDLRFLTEIDFVRHVALVAVLPSVPSPMGHEEGRMVGVARYVSYNKTGPVSPVEFAVTVGDEFQERGIGRLLLHHLAKIARAGGIAELRAAVLGENRQVMEIVGRSGLEFEETSEGGVVYVSVRLG